MKPELHKIETLGVISKIEEPTEWCSTIVVIPKPNGTVQICVDLTKLNASVQRERLLLTLVEQTLAQISGAKYWMQTPVFGKSSLHLVIKVYSIYYTFRTFCL